MRSDRGMVGESEVTESSPTFGDRRDCRRAGTEGPLQILFEIMTELRRKNRNEFESGGDVDAENMTGRGRRSNGLLPPPHQLSRVFYFVTRISTRRFFARPTGVVFGSIGLLSA